MGSLLFMFTILFHSVKSRLDLWLDLTIQIIVRYTVTSVEDDLPSSICLLRVPCNRVKFEDDESFI